MSLYFLIAFFFGPLLLIIPGTILIVVAVLPRPAVPEQPATAQKESSPPANQNKPPSTEDL